jgi:hypothetical protein
MGFPRVGRKRQELDRDTREREILGGTAWGKLSKGYQAEG